MILSGQSWPLRPDRRVLFWLTLSVTLLAWWHPTQGQESGFGPPISVPREVPRPDKPQPKASNWIDQSLEEVRLKSQGCLECHKGIDQPSMHSSPNVVLGCTDCHGGNPTPGLTQRKAHVQPLNPIFWESSANPNDSSVLLNRESPEFIQFVNPGDLRVATNACGLCHAEIVKNVSSSMMRHGALLWGAALYNNGSVPHKNYRYGQAYGTNGVALRLINPEPVTPEDTRLHGILPFIDPLPRFPLSQPGNILRIFEKGGEKQLVLGIPFPFEPPGRPLRRLSERGLGTLNRIDPVFLNLQKTRLHDPLLDFMGSNDHSGDYRSSGCSACHTVYANDRSPTHSGWYSKYGHQGLSFSGDNQISKKERGHPIQHEFTRAIPSSQCMTCHMHQGNLFVNPFLGYTWWDQESDGEFMYPKEQKNPTQAEMAASLRHNPEAAAARGEWTDLDFLDKVAQLNPKLQHTQFADYHGHGWVFRAVFKKDRQGNLLDLDDNIIPHDDAHKWARAVHLKDVHLAHGMHCADCHFDADVHGNGKLYGETRAATTIECIDCHGMINARPTLVTSGNGGQIDLRESNTSWGPRFIWEGKRLFQRSSMSPYVRWEIPQTVDTIDPASRHYNPKSRYAKTLRRDGKTWGDVPDASKCARELAHDNQNISCQICHSSWATTCFGCHLPMRANQRVPLNKFEGILTRNYTSYNPQVIRDDVFQLGIDATYKNHRLAVLRSSSAVVVGSQNGNREWVYSQQQTVSAEGYSGQAFNPHFPHTTSGVGTTKNCTDCHLSASNDNNAWMTQVLGFGTGTVNFFGRYAWVGAGKDGFYGVVWTEQEEPQAALGSHLHKLAYPDNFRRHLEQNKGELKEAHHHHARNILDLTLRGEYLYTANGPDGFEVFDVANIDNKGFSERIVSTPVSPLGQRTHVRTKYATSVTLPSTLGIDPLRGHAPKTTQDAQFGEIYSDNEEQDISPIYGFVYVTDREEGLVICGVGTLVDGNPQNNFLDKEPVIRFNPEGKLTGAMHSHMAGRYLYLACRGGLEVIDIGKPAEPKIVGELRDNFLKEPRSVAVQFRYAFVTDADGLKVIDITEATNPKPVLGGVIPLAHAGRPYLARTYAYVPNGPEGLAIINIQNPEKPRLETMFNAGGALSDTRAVQIGSVNASMFALVADGKNGLKILQMISPDTVPGHMGYSPVPNPKLIASFPTPEPAVAVSRGLDRDRIVDETGNQTVVFGRRGSRPFHTNEMAGFYRHWPEIYPSDSDAKRERTGQLYRVEDPAWKAGRLVSKTGVPLATPLDFKSLDGPDTVPTRPSTQRLDRRGK
jgi:hypothetical protein